MDIAGTGTGGTKGSKDPRDWPFKIRTYVKDGKDTDINAVIKCTNFAEMDGPKTIKAWSIVDFLLSEHREKFIKFCEDLRTKDDNGEKSFKEIFGWSLADLDLRWKAYVKSAYAGL